MRQPAIQSIDVTSDGIVVAFLNGIRCYYPAHFLLDHLSSGSNQVLLDYDPTPNPAWDFEPRRPEAPKPRVC